MDLGYTLFAIDFDGTIVQHRYPHIGEELPGAIETMNALQAQGDKIILWTCRTGKLLDEALLWLMNRGFVPDCVNQNHEDVGDTSNLSQKIYCHHFLDDRNWPEFPGWLAVRNRFVR